jgi:hypothetical protein
MRESVIYQDILQQGVETGQKQALKTSILEALETRFGAAPPELNFRLEGLTPERLHGLLRLAWTCVTVNDFISQLA